MLKIEYFLLRKRRIYDVLSKQIIHGFRLIEHSCGLDIVNASHISNCIQRENTARDKFHKYKYV